MPALVQIMTWSRIGNTPLPEPVMAYFTDMYMRYSALMSWLVDRYVRLGCLISCQLSVVMDINNSDVWGHCTAYCVSMYCTLGRRLIRWPLEMRLLSWIINFQTHIKDIWRISCEKCHQVNATRPRRCLVNIGAGNDLVPSGTKQLPDAMLTQIYVAIRRH